MRFLKRFMPQEDKFQPLFERHAAEIAAAARSLRAGLDGDGHALRDVVLREEAADAITRDVLLATRRSFITPFDRGAIMSLVTAMDDSIDEMNKTVSGITLFGVTQFTDEMRGMADRIVLASALVERAVPLLRAMGTNANDLIDLCGQVVVIEGEADAVHRAGIKALWDARGGLPAENPDVPAMGDMDGTSGGLERFIVGERLLDRLEKVMDRLEDVADVMHGIVIEHV